MFKDDMFRALLDGRKTNTRRLDGLHEINKNPDNFEYSHIYKGKYMFLVKDNIGLCACKSKYQVGDIVGIRENFYIMKLKPTEYHSINFEYNIDREFKHTILTDNEWAKYRKWKNQTGSKSKLFMFDSLIRYKMQIKNIRVERINDISIEDCINEGIPQTWGEWFGKAPKWAIDSIELNQENGGDHIWTNRTSKENFQILWDSINKKRGYGWDENSWVFVYDIKQVNK